MKIIRSLIAGFCLLSILTFPLVAATVVRPTLTITNLKSGQLLSNDTFTVLGTATGGAGVTNVLFSLNQDVWTNATSGNNWANWSAAFNLIPGTNTFSACAVDNAGVSSLTNTVRFAYYVTAVLTVRTNGSGTISPAYDGNQLQIGAAYTITATASKTGQKNYGFRNWTDGSNNIITNKATLRFIMASNLTLIANFGDISLPLVTVLSTSTNADGNPNDFIVHGTAKDNMGVTNLFYKLNTGDWLAASSTNNWTNWVASVSLQPGVNDFYAYAMDNSGNKSIIFFGLITYNSAPLNLANKFAVVSVNSTNNLAPFTVVFGKNVFSQTAGDTNSFNAVGSYTYLDSGGSATLKYKYTGPPSAVGKGSQTLGLTFLTPTYAYFTNVTAKTDGIMQFSSVSNLALTAMPGQLLWTFGGNGGGNGVLFQKSTFTAQTLLPASASTGSYTYKQYSPVGILLKLVRTNGTSYVLANFGATNYGDYYEEDYDKAGHTNGTDNGNFLVASQKPGGNAPAALTNQNLDVVFGGENFNDQFGADTYSQDTRSTNFDNAVGDYTYNRASTNVGQLNLTITEPPTLAGSNSAARLVFVSGNTGFFTNEDSTISPFVLTSVTNLAPASITNNTRLTINYDNGGGSGVLQFTNDGTFSFDGAPDGTYDSTNYSPGGTMIHLAVTSGFLDWLQLNFETTNSGTFYGNEFDATTNNDDSYSGTFTLH